MAQKLLINQDGAYVNYFMLVNYEGTSMKRVVPEPNQLKPTNL